MEYELMIFAAIDHVQKKLNQYLMTSYGTQQDVVVVSNMIAQDGSAISYANNKLVISLVNIEKDTLPKTLYPAHSRSSQQLRNGNTPLHFNLYILISANFAGERYEEGLKIISHTLQYFQRTPFYDHNNSPDLDAAIDKLILEIENIDLQNLHGIWSTVGNKYMPSILYKLRMVSVSDLGVTQVPVSVASPSTQVEKIEN